MDRHDSPAVSLARGRTGLSRGFFLAWRPHAKSGDRRNRDRPSGVISQNFGRRSQDGAARRLLGVLLNWSGRAGSQPGYFMTRDNLLFVISVVWFVSLCGVAAWLLLSG